MEIDIKKPRTCKTNNHLNTVPSSDSTSEESIIEQHFWVKLTILFFNKVIGNLQSRFSEGKNQY